MSISADFSGLQAAIDEMGTVSGQISKQLEDMMSQVQSQVQKLSGQHVDAYNRFQNKVHTLEAQMQQDLTKGQQALDEMMTTHKNSDLTGATYLGG